MTATEFGQRIAGLRNEKKMTQTELAEVLGVSTQAVSKWETGGGFPDVQTIPNIARALDTTTDYLFDRVRRQQKVFVFNVLEGDGMPSRGPNYRRKYEAVLNDDYLTKGWHVVNTRLSSEEESTYMMVVVERED